MHVLDHVLCVSELDICNLLIFALISLRKYLRKLVHFDSPRQHYEPKLYRLNLVIITLITVGLIVLN